MICARIFCAFALCSLLATSGCKPIPTEPETNLDGLVYTNNDWGFRVSRPSDQWGIDVSTLTSQRDPNNGLSPVTVRILSPQFTRELRPQMHLYPQALPARFTTMTLDQLVQVFEEEYLMRQFDQYRVIGEKQRIRLRVGEAMQWEFPLFSTGTIQPKLSRHPISGSHSHPQSGRVLHDRQWQPGCRLSANRI